LTGGTLIALVGVLILRLLLTDLEPVPVVGTIVTGPTASVGLGAVAMTRFGQRT
jgi:hypothetical protein